MIGEDARSTEAWEPKTETTPPHHFAKAFLGYPPTTWDACMVLRTWSGDVYVYIHALIIMSGLA